MSEPYLLTRVGADGVDERGARYILGPPLGPSYQELRVQLEQERERLDNESELRVKAQQRVDTAARVFASIARSHPDLAEVIEQARKDIWGTDR